MNAYDSLQQRSREIAGYNSTASLLSWDQETYMPPKAGAYRAEQLSQLAGLTHHLGTAPEVGDWLKACEDDLPPCADEAETVGAAYRSYRKLQHTLRLDGMEKARVDPDTVSAEREVVLGLWRRVFG